MNETMAREIIQAVFNREDDPFAELTDEAIELACEAAQKLMAAVPQRNENEFIFAAMTLTYIGAGFQGRKAMDATFALAKLHYRAGRNAIKQVCAEAVDELIASLPEA